MCERTVSEADALKKELEMAKSSMSEVEREYEEKIKEIEKRNKEEKEEELLNLNKVIFKYLIL